jgi:Flp pilus assembly pilin Flp
MGKDDNNRKGKMPRLDSRGQGLIEYLLMLMLITMVVLLAVTSIGQTVSNKYDTVTSTMPQ